MPDWLRDEAGLAIVRRAYARQMLGAGNIRNDRLEEVTGVAVSFKITKS
jgi:hypothetical protein